MSRRPGGVATGLSIVGLLVGSAAAVEVVQLTRLRSELAQVRASRVRIIEAADAARRRLERELHDGAQQQLVSTALTLRLARGKLTGSGDSAIEELIEEASTELTAALGELRELARSSYPVLLTDAGLGPALESLVRRSTIPAVLATVPEHRLPAPIEQTCYFVVSEAIANAERHANAHEVNIAVVKRGDRVNVEVADDGMGGAELRSADGADGLQVVADRVAAYGGRLQIVSPPGGGTRVRADLPCE